MEESRSGSLRQAAAAAFPLTIPVFTGFLVLGMAYGVLMQTNGYGAFWSTLMSAVAFCGSMQFAAITLLTLSLIYISAAHKDRIPSWPLPAPRWADSSAQCGSHCPAGPSYKDGWRPHR